MEIRHQAVHDSDPRIGLRHLDMDVQSADWISQPHHSKIADNFRITPLLRHALLMRLRLRCVPAARMPNTVFLAHLGQNGAVTSERRMRVLRPLQGRGRYFDLGLQQLGRQLLAELSLGSCHESLRQFAVSTCGSGG
jgi:hypothetical protein